MMKKYFLIIVAWVLIIVGALFWQEYGFLQAKEIVVKTFPVDPYDFFRGNYVTLSYDFSRGKTIGVPASEHDVVPVAFSGSTLQTLPKSSEKETVYAVLKQDHDRYILDHFTAQKPTKDEVFIQGQIASSWADRAQIIYGIEEFFVPDGEGKKWEEHQGKDLMVRLLVTPEGRARVKELFLAK